MRSSGLHSFASIRLISPLTWLAGVLILLSFPNAFAQSSDFSAFWKEFKSAVSAGDKLKVAGITKFPLSMPYGVKAVKDKEDFLRRYNEIFKGEANAAQCFKSAEPHKESDRQYEIYCPFKETPDDRENAPIRFVFELLTNDTDQRQNSDIGLHAYLFHRAGARLRNFKCTGIHDAEGGSHFTFSGQTVGISVA